MEGCDHGRDSAFVRTSIFDTRDIITCFYDARLGKVLSGDCGFVLSMSHRVKY